jgi:hypothetical protein
MEEIMIGREMNSKEMIPEEENQEGAKAPACSMRLYTRDACLKT